MERNREPVGMQWMVSETRSCKCMCFFGVEFISHFDGAPTSLCRVSGLAYFSLVCPQGPFIVTCSGRAACQYNTKT